MLARYYAELRQPPQGNDVSEVLNYFNAAWITMIKEGVCNGVSLGQEDWLGPILGPLFEAISFVDDAVIEGGELLTCEGDSFYAINLARHITAPERRSLFESWLKEVLDRLIRYHSSEGKPKVKNIFSWLKKVLDRLTHNHSSDGKQKVKNIFDTQFFLGDPVPPSLFVTDKPYDPSIKKAKDEIINLAQTIRGSNSFLILDEDFDLAQNSEEIGKMPVNLITHAFPQSPEKLRDMSFYENALYNLSIPIDLADQAIDKDWKYTGYHLYPHQDPDRDTPMSQALEFKTSAALLALMAGSMFWAYERLRKHTDADIIRTLAEAIFCYQVDPLYLKPNETYRSMPLTFDFQLPEGAAASYPGIFFMYYEFEYSCWPVDPPTIETACTLHLTRYIMPKKDKRYEKWYEKWTKAVIKKLNLIAWLPDPYNGSLPPESPPEVWVAESQRIIGQPLSPWALNVNETFDPVRNAEEIDKMLKAIDPAKNPFLRTAEELKAEGFVGKPYCYPQ